ncbi:MAG: 30S ribosomal protein S6 [Candidatus Peribacteraceae bacterium]|jgi:small subunit ribosomal protein S6|nr:30S ribosomal protein S6 [Candidatus Peribacteraceae bacterium]MDP7454272.1 30S ribosomal protein S6 [Candidatus Peribacteraceae bacterium]MDP7645762.1 30S ribosomal protein S6 [Candidatus Peribacteraceae bacterium]
MTSSDDTIVSASAKATADETDDRVYECCVLLPFPLSQKEEQDAMKEVEGYFEEAGGRQMAKDSWGRRGLAYPIGGSEEGTFVVYHYEMDPSRLKEIDEQLNISTTILRHMLIKPPKGYQITKYSEEYETWLKERKTVSEQKEEEKEAEIKRKVAEKAKRQVKKVEEEKKARPPTVPEKSVIEKDKLSEELEKLISDDELDI